jgi:hypothetical protein
VPTAMATRAGNWRWPLQTDVGTSWSFLVLATSRHNLAMPPSPRGCHDCGICRAGLPTHGLIAVDLATPRPRFTATLTKPAQLPLSRAGAEAGGGWQKDEGGK